LLQINLEPNDGDQGQNQEPDGFSRLKIVIGTQRRRSGNNPNAGLPGSNVAQSGMAF
jgi:hypothetical protein